MAASKRPNRRKTPKPVGPPPEPWERQPTETAKAFASFCVYRDLKPLERSLPRAASDSGVAFTSMRDWSQLHAWPARAKLWDQRLDQIRRNELIQEAIDMGRRQAHQAANIAAALSVPALALAQKMRSDPGVMDELSQEDTQRLIALNAATAKAWPGVAAAERLARGFSTEHIEVTSSLEGSTDEQLKGQPVRSMERIAAILAAAQETGHLPPDVDVQGLLPPGDD